MADKAGVPIEGDVPKPPSLLSLIHTYDKWLPDELCERLIALMHGLESTPLLHNSPGDAAALHVELRTNLRHLLERYKADIKCEDMFTNINRFEAPMITCVSSEGKEGESKRAFADAWNDKSALRSISVVMYLSDHESGATTFPNLTVHPQKGRVLMFPSSGAYPHFHARPDNGAKYMVMTWLCLNAEHPEHFYATYPL